MPFEIHSRPMSGDATQIGSGDVSASIKVRGMMNALRRADIALNDQSSVT